MAALATGDVGPLRVASVALGGGLFLISDATIILGEQLATSPRQEVVLSGIVMATYAAALALLVHGLRDEPLRVTHEPRGTPRDHPRDHRGRLGRVLPDVHRDRRGR